MKGGKREGSGRPEGSLNKKTLEKKAAEEQFINRVIKNVDKLFNAQLALAEGTNFVYRIDYYKDESGKKQKKFVLVTDPTEIVEVLDETEAMGGVVNENYYIVTTKAPDNKAIDSLMDRAFGKSVTKIAGTGDDGEIKVSVTNYGNNPTLSVPAS